MMLLPKDPNDDRNVMLEIRAGTGGDEASIFAGNFITLLSLRLFILFSKLISTMITLFLLNSGDLVNIYKKYAENNGWKVIPIEETRGTDGGYKTCVVQINGDFVYSKVISISIFPNTHFNKKYMILNIL